MNRFSLQVLLLACLWLTTSKAQSVFLTGEGEKLDIETAFVFIDSTNRLGIEEISAASFTPNFKKHTKQDLCFGYESNNIWLRFQVRNTRKMKDLVLVQYLSSLDYNTFYAQDEKGHWTETIQGDRLKYSEREIKNRFFVFPLQLKQDSTYTFYFKGQTTTSAQIPLGILPREAFNQEYTVTEMGYGFFYGMLGVMLFYNLFLFFALRDWAYLFYVLNVTATFLFTSCLAGHLNVFVFQDMPLLANRMMPFSSAFLMTTAGAFLLVFLKVGEYAGRWKYLLYLQIIFGLSVMIASLFADYGEMTHLLNSTGLFTTILSVLIGIICLRRGNPYAKYYLLAFGAYIIGIIVIVLRNTGVLPLNFWTIHSVEIGPSIELILLAFALSHKYNNYRKEKEEATELALRVQKEANETLEAKVQQRTEQLRSTLGLVEEERKKSDNLLLNILPADTAKELKETGKATPKHYDSVTVLFTDFKDFTRITRNLDPDRVIEKLNNCFRAFDEICEKYNLEKIKTIGDSFMCVGGIPVPNSTNAVDAVHAGMEMQKWAKEWNEQQSASGEEPWQLRLGVHTGSVITGVVGKNKFAYDVWGDTVNLASRMENKGEVGRVNISGTTYERVKDLFDCSFRGKVSVKNSGETEMYFVEKIK